MNHTLLVKYKEGKAFGHIPSNEQIYALVLKGLAQPMHSSSFRSNFGTHLEYILLGYLSTFTLSGLKRAYKLILLWEIVALRHRHSSTSLLEGESLRHAYLWVVLNIKAPSKWSLNNITMQLLSSYALFDMFLHQKNLVRRKTQSYMGSCTHLRMTTQLLNKCKNGGSAIIKIQKLFRLRR